MRGPGSVTWTVAALAGVNMPSQWCYDALKLVYLTAKPSTLQTPNPLQWTMLVKHKEAMQYSGIEGLHWEAGSWGVKAP